MCRGGKQNCLLPSSLRADGERANWGLSGPRVSFAVANFARGYSRLPPPGELLSYIQDPGWLMQKIVRQDGQINCDASC